MRHPLSTKTLFCTCVSLLGITLFCKAQQCTSFGDPVVNITFGSGSNPGPALPSTNYHYVSVDCPQDGYYAVRNSTYNCNGSTWFNISSDHTGDPNGYFMLINASTDPGDFYLDTVKGLCANTTYQFAAWIANVLIPSACNGIGNKPNITFSIEAPDGTSLAKSFSGDIPAQNGIVWTQYGLVFTTPPGITDIVLRMTNNANGGCGNDLALDDITFRPCGPKVQAGITGNITGSDTISYCIDGQSSLTFDGAASPGYNTPSYQWQVSTDTGHTWNDIPGQQGTSYTRPVSATPAFYQYRLIVGEGSNVNLPSCRVSSNDIAVRVSPKPAPDATNDGPKCEGDTITLKATDGAQYAWTGPGGFTAASPTVPIDKIAATQSGQYQVLVTSAYGCTQTDVTNVVVYPYPNVQFAAAAPTCEKTVFGFADQSSAAGQLITGWKWYFGDGDSAMIQSPTHVYDTTGNYPVGLIVTTDKGCSNPQPKVNSMAVHPLPHPDFSLPKVCLADPQALFNDSSTIADGTGSQFTYNWDFGEPSTGANNSSTQKNGAHKYQVAGPFSVHLKVTSGNGCSGDTTKAFTVNGQNPIPNFTIDNAALLCSNQPVILTDGSSVTPGSIIRVDVYWDYLNDPAAKMVDDTPSAGKKYDHVYPDFSSPASKSYRLYYVVYSGQTCFNPKTQDITVLASPKTQFDALNNICEEIRTYQLTEGHELTGFAGSGAYSGRGVSQLGYFVPHNAGPGPDTLRYTFTGDNGCSASSDQTIVVYPQPAADAGPTQYILQGETGILEGSGNGNNISYSWSPADSILGSAKIPRPQVSPLDNLVYTLTVTSADGCTDSSKVEVVVLQPLVVPNAFSPNGDGINDTWVIRYLNEYPTADVEVFNRYGQPVYHATGGYRTPWDGTYKGQPLPVGTYYWIIRPGSGRKQISGSVTILR
ncbi:MAG TPA: PKD domain-containing protein [Puia sp.]|nr:PKD domain-containing protein [Puia sp.]